MDGRMLISRDRQVQSMDGECCASLVGFYACANLTSPKHSWNVFLFTCICLFSMWFQARKVSVGVHE